jgi:chromosome segregation ATPase
MEESGRLSYNKTLNTVPQTLMMDHVTPATRLLEKRRQMFEVQEALNAQNEEFSRREDAFRRREEGLRRKDLELQESLIKFNKFLQENESKRNRALKRASDERKQRESKDIEIKRYELQLNDKILEENLLKTEVEKNLKYQEYLENVVHYLSKDFPEISDVLNRYKTLKDVNIDLNQKQREDDSETEKAQREFLSFRKENENVILNYGNEVAELQIRLEICKNRTMRLQNEIDLSNYEISEKTLELGQIISSVSNILERCEHSFRLRHNKPSIQSAEKTNDFVNDSLSLTNLCKRSVSKLDEIAMFIIDYRDIYAEYMADMAHGDGISNLNLGGGGVGGGGSKRNNGNSVVGGGGGGGQQSTYSESVKQHGSSSGFI